MYMYIVTGNILYNIHNTYITTGKYYVCIDIMPYMGYVMMWVWLVTFIINILALVNLSCNYIPHIGHLDRIIDMAYVQYI